MRFAGLRSIHPPLCTGHPLSSLLSLCRCRHVCHSFFIVIIVPITIVPLSLSVVVIIAVHLLSSRSPSLLLLSLSCWRHHFLPPLIIISPPPCLLPLTCPPCEQLLVAVEVGAGPSVGVVLLPPCCSSFLFLLLLFILAVLVSRCHGETIT